MKQSKNYGFHIQETEDAANGPVFSKNWEAADEILGEMSEEITEVKTGSLLKNNETEFDPTKPYHPATKKYVDESVGDLYSYGTADLIAGTSVLETGKLHFVYE